MSAELPAVQGPQRRTAETNRRYRQTVVRRPEFLGQSGSAGQATHTRAPVGWAWRANGWSRRALPAPEKPLAAGDTVSNWSRTTPRRCARPWRPPPESGYPHTKGSEQRRRHPPKRKRVAARRSRGADWKGRWSDPRELGTWRSQGPRARAGKTMELGLTAELDKSRGSRGIEMKM